MTDDPVRDFADELIDDLRIAETVTERDAQDSGERLSLEELLQAHDERKGDR